MMSLANQAHLVGLLVSNEILRKAINFQDGRSYYVEMGKHHTLLLASSLHAFQRLNMHDRQSYEAKQLNEGDCVRTRCSRGCVDIHRCLRRSSGEVDFVVV